MKLLSRKKLTRIELKGRLADKYGECFSFDISTAYEAINALCSQVKGFKEDFRSGQYSVYRTNKEHEIKIESSDEFLFQLGENKVVIVPEIGGAATGAFILVTLAITYVATKLFAPIIKPLEYPADLSGTPEFVFNGPTNISAQGVGVPLVYGRMRVGSVLVSASIVTEIVPRTDLIYTLWREMPDTLNVVDIISEGEIGGLVDDARSIYFNNTPLNSSSSTYNSSDVEVLTGNIYELPSGHGQNYSEEQSILVAGFTLAANNGIKTIAEITGDQIEVYEALSVEASGDTITITSYIENFANVIYRERIGTSIQDHVPGFSQIESTIAVGQTITPAAPVIRTITGANLDAIRVTVIFPQGFYLIDFENDITLAWIRITIDVKPFGGSYSTITSNQLWGRRTSQRKIDFRIDLPSGVSSWDVRVSKVAWVPRDAHGVVNTVEWSAYTTIIDAKLSYPDTALMNLSLNAKDFGGRAPRRSYEIDGIKLQIPSNYDPITRVYTGIWDGTFITAWTNNPAWVLYDLLSSTRYGLGSFINVSQIDKWELYNIAQFCDGMVDNGFGFSSNNIAVIAGNIYQLPSGHTQTYQVDQIITAHGFTNASNNGLKTVTNFSGDQITVSETLVIESAGQDVSINQTEPRYTFNGVFGKRESAYKNLTAMISNFHGLIYWGANGNVNFAQERDDKTAVKLVTPANVIDGLLTYSGTELSQQHSVALVSWNDPENNYERSVEVVEDAALIARLGWKPTDVIAFGCTSRGQAHRYGRYILITESYETERLTYRAAFDHADVSPGDIISVADNAYSGVRFGGRISARTLSSVTIDAAIELEVGETYEISVILADGTIEERSITNSPGAGQTVMTLASPLTSLPVAGSLWIINASNVEPREFNVISVKEVEKNIFEIYAVFRLPDKFSIIETDFFIEDNSYSIFEIDTGELPVVSGIAAREYTYLDGGAILSAARISWLPPTDVKEAGRVYLYELQFKSPNADGFVPVSATTDEESDLLNIREGIYQVRVRVVDRLGATGAWITASFDLLGAKAPPSDVENFSIQVTGETALLTWSAVPDVDISHYRIRYSAATVSAEWDSSIDIVPQATGLQAFVQARVGTYLIKAVDVYGSESVNAALIASTIAGLTGFNVVETITEYPDYLGVHVDTVVIAGVLQLVGSDVMADWIPLASAVPLASGDVAPEGTYYFYNSLDLGAVYTSRLTASFDATGFNRITGLPAGENWEVILQVRTTNDDPGGTPTWTDWADFLISDYTARAFEWRIKLFSYDVQVTPFVENLQVIVDMPDRVVGESDISCPALGLQVDYDPYFKERPALAVDGQDLSTGDYHKVTLADEEGFYIQFFNSGASGIATTFDFLAKGYGVSE